MTDYYVNVENDHVYSLGDLRAIYAKLAKEDPDNFSMESFYSFMQNCLSKNGSLRQLLSADFIRSAYTGNVDLYAYADNGCIYDCTYSAYFDQIFFCIPANVKIYGYIIAKQ